MTTREDDSTATSVHFKRRKTTHTKRARADDGSNPAKPSNETPDATLALDAPEPAQDDDEAVPNLKEILRNRKRPRDRLKDTARKPEPGQTELVQVDAPRQDRYTSRFVAQTGQVVDSSDAHMTAFVEARLAEQNLRKYGWPIPSHLRAAVAALTPDTKTAPSGPAPQTEPPAAPADGAAKHNNNNRATAAGQGRLEEVDLGASTSRTHKDWARLDKPPAPPRVRLRRDGKPFRNRNRRTSDDMRRDALVDAVLRESKIDFFDAAPAAQAQPATDDDMLKRFEAEYYEAAEERMARKPPAPVAKDGPKGPKLGGSRSQRAAMVAMREREEPAAKKSGTIVNDGRVLERWEWTGMRVDNTAWYTK